MSVSGGALGTKGQGGKVQAVGGAAGCDGRKGGRSVRAAAAHAGVTDVTTGCVPWCSLGRVRQCNVEWLVCGDGRRGSERAS